MKKSTALILASSAFFLYASAANATLKIAVNTDTAKGGPVTFDYNLYDGPQNAGTSINVNTRNAADTQQVISMLTEEFNEDASGFKNINGPSKLTVSFPTQLNQASTLVTCQFDSATLQHANSTNQVINLPADAHCQIQSVA